jgi:hypothetical protein
MARHSPWLADVVGFLENLARHEDGDAFSKQAMFAGRMMGGGIRAKSEFMSTHQESAMPIHLRRKVNQGGSGHFNSKPTAEPEN